MRPIVILTCLIAAALAQPAQAEPGRSRMYKCIDKAGKVYYTDKMNPDCGQSAELNQQGVILPKKDVAKPGQPSKTDPAAAIPKKTREEERRDRALLATYTTEEEIDAARDRNLAIPAQGTQNVESKLGNINSQLAALKKQADALVAQKKPLPARLQEDINSTQRQATRLEADLAQRKSQADAIRARYEADKLRFRELKATGSQ